MLAATQRRSALGLALAVTVLGAGAAQQPPAEPTPDFGEVLDVRTGFVRVVLPGGAPPLGVEDVEVLWKRRPQKLLRVVGGAGDPLELGVAVDRSASFHHAFEPLRQRVLEVIEGGLGPDDRLFTVAFTDQPRWLGAGRGQAARVLASLPAAPETGSHPTALFDTLAQVLERFENADARAALLVASDGCNTASGFHNATMVARRARDLAIPIFLLMPDRDACQFTRCVQQPTGEWQCEPENAPTVLQSQSRDIFNPAARTQGMSGRSEAGGATAERRQFAALIEDAGGGAYVVRDPAGWQRALDEIFERLSRQWLIVFEPSGPEVSSDEVRVYSSAGGRRQRLR